MFAIGALVPWHIAVILTLIWPVLSLICIATFCPESPIWLLNKGRDEQAEQALMRLRGDERIVKAELKRLKSALMEMEMAMKDHGEQMSGVQEVIELLTDKAFDEYQLFLEQAIRVCNDMQKSHHILTSE